ncbi:MAG: hypothetical protein ACR2LI_04805 [Propionibacteriaceae bacterium]
MFSATVIVWLLDAAGGVTLSDRLTAVLGVDHRPSAEIEVVGLVASGSPGASELQADRPWLRLVSPRDSADLAWADGVAAAQGCFLQLADATRRLDLHAIRRLAASGVFAGSDVVLPGSATASAAAILGFDLGDVLLGADFLRRAEIGGPGHGLLADRHFLTAVALAGPMVSVGPGPGPTRALDPAPTGPGDAKDQTTDPVPLRLSEPQLVTVAGLLAQIDAGTTPGSRRDALTASMLRRELLAPLAAAGLAAMPVTSAHRLAAATHDLLQRVPVEVERHLGPGWALLATVARSGSPEEISEVADRLNRIGVSVWLTQLAPRAATVELGFTASLREGKAPLRLSRSGPSGWRLPASLVGPVAVEDRSIAVDPDQRQAELVLRHRQSTQEWILPGDGEVRLTEVDGTAELEWIGSAVLDPSTAAAGRPLGHGIWDFFVRVDAFGLIRDRRLGAQRLECEPAGWLAEPPLIVRPQGQLDRLYYTDQDNLSLSVRAGQNWLPAALRDGRLEVTGEGVRYESRVRWARTPADVGLHLDPVGGGPVVRWRLRSGPHGGGWTATPGRARLQLARGVYRIALSPDQGDPGIIAVDDDVDLGSELVVDRSVWWRWLRSAGVSLLRRTKRRPGR